ncbi:MAG: hypothetical protein WCF99_03255 [Chloroflexales bacterium]
MIADKDGTILCVLAGRWRYAISQAQIEHFGLIDPVDAPIDQRGHPLICRHLATLLGDAEVLAPGRHHAMTVVLRRRSVALLVNHIDTLDGTGPYEIHPLSPLITRRLTLPWFLGAIIYQDAPLLLLDLHRIATDVAIGAV